MEITLKSTEFRKNFAKIKKQFLTGELQVVYIELSKNERLMVTLEKRPLDSPKKSTMIQH